MHSEARNEDGPHLIDDGRVLHLRSVGAGKRTIRATKPVAKRAAGVDPSPTDTEQALSDADQSTADTDQTLSDADQAASYTDETDSDRDQDASDQDQAASDRQHAASHNLTAADEIAYDSTRTERDRVSYERLRSRLQRRGTIRERDRTADLRDRVADRRDKGGRARDARAIALAPAMSQPKAVLLKQLEELSAKAAADRARAAADRARAARDRADAAVERARLEAELRSAHLDELTGAYRREMGRLALSHEIDRARRSDGRFVLAFVDVDRLKVVNDRDGHAAGDLVLQTVVDTIRARLRSFDPIVRFGGDEFVCGLGGTDLAEAERRFDLIRIALDAGPEIGISVGLAAFEIGDTVEELIDRADAAMLVIKARHHDSDAGIFDDRGHEASSA